jgi:hypothetical protein
MLTNAPLRFLAYSAPNLTANASALYSNALVIELVMKWSTALIGANKVAASRREMIVGPPPVEEEGGKPNAERRGELERKRVKVRREKAVWAREVRRR